MARLMFLVALGATLCSVALAAMIDKSDYNIRVYEEGKWACVPNEGGAAWSAKKKTLKSYFNSGNNAKRVVTEGFPIRYYVNPDSGGGKVCQYIPKDEYTKDMKVATDSAVVVTDIPKTYFYNTWTAWAKSCPKYIAEIKKLMTAGGEEFDDAYDIVEYYGWAKWNCGVFTKTEED